MDLNAKAEYGRRAVERGTPDYEHNDDETNAVDAIANILIWCDQWTGADTAAVLRMATMNYEAERDGGEEEGI